MALSRIGFDLTTRCNLRCKHCLREEPQKNIDLPFTLIKKVLTQAKRYGVDRIGFTGGEPLLHPRFDDIVRETMAQGYLFSLVSNGIVLKKKLALLSEARQKGKLQALAISLEGPDEKTNDAVRGKGSFRKALESITLLHATQIPLVIKFTFNRLNVHTLEPMALFASHLGAERLELSNIYPTPENMAAGLVLDPEHWKTVQSDVHRLSREFKMTIGLSAGYHDPAAFSMCSHLCMTDLYVDHKGRLCVCCMLPGASGTDRDKPGPDIVADLNKMDLWDAHQKLIEVIAGLFKYRTRRIAKNNLKPTDYFQCISCARYFGKLDWIKQFPDSPWAE